MNSDEQGTRTRTGAITGVSGTPMKDVKMGEPPPRLIIAGTWYFGVTKRAGHDAAQQGAAADGLAFASLRRDGGRAWGLAAPRMPRQ